MIERMNPKVMLKWFPQGRRKTRHCDHSECKKATREGKPFCSDHVSEQPYVKKLMTKIHERESEEARVARQGVRAVDPFGLTAREILLTVWVNGDRTVARLSRELNLDFKTVQHYVKALKRAGLVSVEPTRRGAGIVSLTNQVAQIQDPRTLREMADGQNQSAA